LNGRFSMLLKPMLAHQAKDAQAILCDPDYAAEVKYDGHRAMLVVDGRGVRLLSRLGRDKMDATPFLHGIEKAAPPMVLDGELTVPGGTSSDVADLSKREQLVYVAFDLLAWRDGEYGDSFYERPFSYRRACLEHLVSLIGWPRLQVSELSDDGKALFDRVKAQGGEGVMMKRKDAPYAPGKRSWYWQKVKAWQTYDVVVTGCDAEPTQWTSGPCGPATTEPTGFSIPTGSQVPPGWRAT
jgi:bifunctional non-homologous end joining protein LigD